MAGRAEVPASEPEEQLTTEDVLSSTNGSEISGFKPVLVETDRFSGSAINLYDMPGFKVAGVMEDESPRQIAVMIRMFLTALNNPQDGEQFEVLTFNEMAEVMRQWSMKSAESND